MTERSKPRYIPAKEKLVSSEYTTGILTFSRAVPSPGPPFLFSVILFHGGQTAQCDDHVQALVPMTTVLQTELAVLKFAKRTLLLLRGSAEKLGDDRCCTSSFTTIRPPHG
jgi:hypothetical protein